MTITNNYNFNRYGKSYGRAADDCMADFTEKQRELRRKADMTKSYVRSRSAPKMETIHSRDEIRRELNRFKEINKYKGKINFKRSLRLGNSRCKRCFSIFANFVKQMYASNCYYIQFKRISNGNYATDIISKHFSNGVLQGPNLKP